MKKIHNTSLGGMSFNVEVDAYEHLESYLNAIKEKFSSLTDTEEIIKDIEARAAERFIASKKEVITIDDVKELIAAMGSPEELGEEETQSEEPTKTKKTAPGKPKRLFRNTDDSIIAGVASGLAAWVGIDTTTMRGILVGAVLLGVLTPIDIFGGIVIIGYVLLWIFLPKAESEADKIEMRGEPVTLKNIEAAIEERIDDLKKKSPRDAELRKPFQTFGRVVERIARFLGKAAIILIQVLGVVIAISMAAALIGLFIVSVNVLAQGIPGNIALFDSTILLQAVAGGWPFIIGIISAFFAAGIPLLLLLLLGITLTQKKNKFSNYLTLSLIGIWVVAISILSIVGIRVGAAAEQTAQQLQNHTQEIVETQELEPFSEIIIEDGYSVELVQGDTHSIAIEGSKKAQEELQATVENNTLTLTGKRHPQHTLCIFCENHRKKITITAPSFSSITARDGAYVHAQEIAIKNTTLLFSDGSRGEITLQGEEVYAEAQDGSRIEIEGTATSANIKASSGSHIHIEELKVDEVEADFSEGSGTHIGMVQILKAKARSGSTIFYMSAEEIEEDIREGSLLRQGDHH